MSRIAIVTDSTSDLPFEVKEKWGISTVPLYVQVDNRNFKDGEELSFHQFYELLESGVIPVTSSPPPSEFIRVYQRLADRVDHIISIHITGKGSATIQSAALAARLVKGAEVTVYDSGGVSMGIGFLAIEAARSAIQGLGVKEILSRLDRLKERIHTFAAIPTLKYLQKSGRVTRGQTLLGSLLSIKPVLEIKDGVVEVVDRMRTFPKALARLIDLAYEAVGRKPVVMAVMHADAREEAEKLAAKLRDKLDIKELNIGEVGPALASHGGPGMIGIIFYGT